MHESSKRMRMSSQASTSCGMQKLLDCSSSTPTLLHHDTAVWDDVRMSAVLSAARCIVFSYSSYQKSQKVKHRCPLCNTDVLCVTCFCLSLVYCLLFIVSCTRRMAQGSRCVFVTSLPAHCFVFLLCRCHHP